MFLRPGGCAGAIRVGDVGVYPVGAPPGDGGVGDCVNRCVSNSAFFLFIASKESAACCMFANVVSDG
jgi:hypothetical protein